MDKPIVFLSHSSHNKKELIAIKKLLDERAAGSINFFLSCDGQSIRLGHNWVVSISDALTKAKLMFVFLSPHSLNSRWVHFEAGTAYAKGVQVVPVCLPGLAFNKVSQPLSLLQGFNLHSAETMGNLARVCNEALDLKLREEFNDAEFRQIRPVAIGTEGFFREHTRLVKSVGCRAQSFFNGKLSDAVETFKKIYESEKADWCKYPQRSNDTGETFATHGATLHFYESGIQNPDGDGRDWKEALFITASFGIELFPVNAPVVEAFGKAVGVREWSVDTNFNNAVKTPDWMELTTKLFKTGIRLIGESSFEIEGHSFSSRTLVGTGISALRPSIRDPWLVNLIARLFDVGFLVEADADAPTDVERLAAVLQKTGDDMFTT